MFPTLKTSAVAQYPLERRRAYSTKVARFVDAKEQRWRAHPTELKRWRIRLQQLDETEMEALRGFFHGESGRTGVFSFRDPWTGIEHTSCSLESDEIRMNFVDESRSGTELVVVENRT